MKTDTAFDNQPTLGDNLTARDKGQNQQGDWWIGGAEDRASEESLTGAMQGDGPQGTLLPPSFNIVGAQITFLIGGWCDVGVTRAELIIRNQVRCTFLAKTHHVQRKRLMYICRINIHQSLCKCLPSILEFQT